MKLAKMTAAAVTAAVIVLLLSCCGTDDGKTAADSFTAKRSGNGSIAASYENATGTVSFSSLSDNTESNTDIGNDSSQAVSDTEYVIPDIKGNYRGEKDGKRFYACIHEVKNGYVSFCAGCTEEGNDFVFETEEIKAKAENGKICFEWTDNWSAQGNGEIDLSSSPESIAIRVDQTAPGNHITDPFTTGGNAVILTK